MINFRALVTRFGSIHYISCIIIPSPAMALSKAQIITDEDPWKVSAFVSAIAELFLSVLLLLGAAISFFTSQIVKFFGLEPPCTYIGCSHPLHLHSEGNNHESYTLGSKDLAVMEISADGCITHLGQGKEDQCSCSDNLPRQSPIKLLRCQSPVHAHSNGSSNEGYPTLLSARSCAEVGSGAEDHCEIVKVPAEPEQQGKSEASAMKGADIQCASSDNVLYKRRGRSKRPRRRDIAHVRSTGKLNKTCPALLSSGSNPESNCGLDAEDRGGIIAGEGGSDETNTNVLIHNIASLQHSEPAKGHTMVEDAVEVGSMVDVTSTEVKTALPSARSCSESKGGLIAESRVFFQGSVDSEQQGECEDVDIRNEDFPDHDTVLVHRSVVFEGHAVVDEANTAHASKGEQNSDAETLECLKKTGSMVTRCITEHANMDLLPCEDMVDVCNTEHSTLLLGEDNNCIIRFGSIIARACMKNGTTNNTYVDSGRIGNRDMVNIVKTDSGSLQEKGRNESSTDIINVFCDAIAVGKSLDEPTPRNDITLCTKVSSSAEVIECTCTSVEERVPLTPPSNDAGGVGEADAEDEQEEGLDALKMALQAERSMLAVLETELENERNAAEVATNEAMAMISRLQEEKSAMQMEVAQLQRMSEERADYDEQAMAVLKEILYKRETENMVLEKEIELYRQNLLAGSDGEPNGVWLKEAGSLALQSPSRPLLSIGQDMGLHSPLGSVIDRIAPWMSQSTSNIDSEELNRVSDWQNSNKRSRDFPARSFGIPSEQIDDINHTEGGYYGPHDSYQHVKKISKCSSFTDDGTLSTRESPWAEDLQQLPLEDELKRKLWATQADEGQYLASSSGKKRATSSLTESCGAQSKCGARSENRGEVEGGCDVFVPIHDVYEVHTGSNRSPPRVEERDPPEVLDSTLTTNKELQPRMSRHMTEFPPRFVPTTKLLASEEIQSTPTSLVQTASWDIEKSCYTEDLCERHDLRSLSLVSREERRAELEEIKQLAVRLKALEEDRDLLRETVESFKHREAELSLLQEISKHLLELRTGSFKGVSEGALSEETSITSPSRLRPLKKRRFHSGIGQAQTLLQHQKSV